MVILSCEIKSVAYSWWMGKKDNPPIHANPTNGRMRVRGERHEVTQAMSTTGRQDGVRRYEMRLAKVCVAWWILSVLFLVIFSVFFASSFADFVWWRICDLLRCRASQTKLNLGLDLEILRCEYVCWNSILTVCSCDFPKWCFIPIFVGMELRFVPFCFV